MLPLLPEAVIDGPVRRMVEDAIILELQDLKLPALGGDVNGYVQAVESYQGDVEPSPDDRDLSRVSNGRFPAVLVTTGEAEYDEPTISRDVITYGLEVIVLLVVDNARSAEARARGGVDADPGVYQLLADVHDKLWGAELNVAGAGRLTPVGEAVLERSGQKALWQIGFTIKVDLDSTQDDDLEDFETILSKVNNADDDTADPIAQGSITL